MTINVSSDAGSLHAVYCQPFRHREDAENYLKEPWPPENPNSVADPFDGKPLKAYMPIHGREMFGIEYGIRKNQYLVLFGQFKNGQKVGKVVEIPDHRMSREGSVTVP